MNKKLKRGLVIGGQATVAGALVLGTVGFVSAHKSIELVVDGKAENVRTFGGKVEDAVRAGEVNVTKHDDVSPALDSTISNGDTVRVLSAHQVSYSIDGQDKKVMTTARTVDQLADELDLDADADLNLKGDVQLASSEKLAVVTPKDITLNLEGKQTKLTTTALDVNAVLEEKNTKVSKLDEVKPAGNTVVGSGMTITYNKVTKKKATNTSPVAFSTKRENDSSLEKGKTKTEKQGKLGQRSVVTETTYRNGKKVSSKKVSDKVTRKAEDALVKVGTKAKPKPTSSSSTDSSASSSSSSSSSSKKTSSSKKSSSSKNSEPSGSVSGAWQSLAECESGGNWSINSGNGYYGGLQFSASSWKGAGGTKYAALPHQATPAEQVATAEKLRASGGWGHWPACSASLGLG